MERELPFTTAFDSKSGSVGLTGTPQAFVRTPMSFDVSNLFPGVTSLLLNDGVNVPIARLSSAEVIGIYFSAHWCTRCRSFTPVLSKAYDALKAAGKRFEIVFVSCDRNEETMRSYFAEMPWLCLNWVDLKRIEDDLSNTYECHGIPHLALVNAETGKLITADGRCAVSLGAHAFPFTAASVSAAKKAKARNVLGLLDSGRALGLKPDALPSEAVAIFIGNPDNSASRVVFPLSEATKALRSRIKVVCIPFRVRDPDKQLIFATKFHPDWLVLQNSEALAAAIFDTVDGDAQEALLLVCNSSFSDVIQTDASETVIQHKERGFPWSDEALAQAIEERQRQVASFAQTLHHPGLQFLNGAQIVTRPGGTSHSLDELRLMDCVALYFSPPHSPAWRQRSLTITFMLCLFLYIIQKTGTFLLFGVGPANFSRPSSRLCISSSRRKARSSVSFM
jgi:nucleoredoxin